MKETILRFSIYMLIAACIFICTFLSIISQKNTENIPEETTKANFEDHTEITVEIVETSETETKDFEIEEPTDVTETTDVADTTETYSKPVSIGKFKLTAYCPCSKCCGKWANNRPTDENGNKIVYGSTGEKLVAGVSIAVDPSVIPYGTEVIINGNTYKAQDCGNGIKGNDIDIYMTNHEDALEFGVQYAEVFLAETN